MSDDVATDEIVTIDGEQYSRLMAEEMAKDIDLAHSIRPGVWAVGDNTTLIVGNIAVTSFCAPSRHGYLVDAEGATSEAQTLIETYGRDPGFKEDTTYRYLMLPQDDLKRLLRIVRPAHEEVVRKQAGGFFRKNQRWKWHNFDVAQTLESMVGRALPEPSFAEELRTLRATNAISGPPASDTALVTSVLGAMNQNILERLAQDIEITHRINPKSWSLMTLNENDGVIMFVGQLNTAWVRQDGGGWLFSGTPLAQGFPDVDEANIQTDYANFDGFWIRTHSEEELLHVVATNEPAHERALEALASQVRTRTPRAAKHQGQLLNELSGLVGRELPQPGYIDDLPTSANLASAALPIISGSFSASGLHYTEAQIAAFYTALQTKGFVVLSGISGTGKSKIATGFVDMLPSPAEHGDSTNNEYAVEPIHLVAYMRRERRILIPKRFRALLPLLDFPKSYDVNVQIGEEVDGGRIVLRTDRDFWTLHIPRSLWPQFDEWELGRTVYFEFHLDKSGEEINLLRLSTIPPPSVISGERIDMPGEDDVALKNHLFLAVRPDWRDSTSLLGYYNPLTQTYEWTDFLRFLIRSGDNFRGPEDERISWFVILDEMNLAHVEYYFADLLSVIESGRDVDGWTREALRMTYPELMDDDDVPPRELKLPPNLYIIGTVNMDETTHAFSPKVLDRAFTIELTEVDFTRYPPSAGAGDGATLSDGEKQALLQAFARDGQFARIDKREIGAFVEDFPEVRDRLQSLNDVLRPFRMHFGYRVFDEVAQYLANNELNGMASFEEAFDQAVFMKVLPKFSGSRARLLSPLQEVLGWAIDPEGGVSGVAVSLDPSHSAWSMEPAFSRVAERVRDMLIALERDGFVSFG